MKKLTKKESLQAGLSRDTRGVKMKKKTNPKALAQTKALLEELVRLGYMERGARDRYRATPLGQREMAAQKVIESLNTCPREALTLESLTYETKLDRNLIVIALSNLIQDGVVKLGLAGSKPKVHIFHLSRNQEQLQVHFAPGETPDNYKSSKYVRQLLRKIGFQKADAPDKGNMAPVSEWVKSTQNEKLH